MATEERPRKKPAAKEAEAEAQADKPKRKLPWTTLMVVAGVLLLEAGTIIVVMILNDSPASVSAQPIIASDGSVLRSDDVEELLADGKAANVKRGVTFLYRYRIYAVVSKDSVEDFRKILEKRRATIEDMIRQVIGRLEPKELDEEPGLTTVKRVLTEDFEQVFGSGMIKQLKFPDWTRLRADY